MNNFVTSQIRTIVPIIVGALVSWLITLGIELDADSQTGLVVFLTGLLQAVYYFIARLLEKKYPSIGGFLLGSQSKPVYKKAS